jgi:hypothetical protein
LFFSAAGERSRARSLLAAVVLAVSSASSVSSISSPALAQTDSDKATARELAKEGADALEKKDFARAADRFTRADKLFHAPTLVLGLARAQVGLGKLVAAQENYHSILREELPPHAPEAFVQAQADARKELVALTPQVPWVVLSVEGARDLSQAKVKIGGDLVPPAALGVKRAIDPGEHTVHVELEGYLPAEKRFTVAPGVTEAVTITLSPATPHHAPPKATAGPVEPPPSGGLFPHQNTVGIVLIGVGSAGVLVGAVTGGLALQKHDDLEAAGCVPEGCPASQQEALRSYHTLGTVSTVGFITGGVGVAAGLVLVLTAPKAPKKADAKSAIAPLAPSVRPYIGAGEIGVVGRF